MPGGRHEGAPLYRERTLPADEAVRLADAEIRRLGLEPTARRIGPPEFPLEITELREAGRLVAVGTGKGVGAQARASSVFEALERFHTVTRTNSRYRDPVLLPAPEVTNQAAARDDLVVQRWLREFPDAVAACSTYTGRSGEYAYPLFLNDPVYFAEPVDGDDPRPYRSMLRYTSSIGTAAGVNAVDARLHGLCELVEHDSVSHALLRWSVRRDDRVTVVSRATLPDHMSKLFDQVIAIVGGQVAVIDVTTDLGVPSYLAVAETPGRTRGIYGAGAAPDAAHAVERALLEVVQTAVTYDAEVVRSRVDRLSEWPFLLDCLSISPGRLLAGTVTEAAISAVPAGLDGPVDAIAWLERHLADRGIAIYVRELTGPESHISVVATIAPQLERFSLVLLGLPVVPTGRAQLLFHP